MTPRTCLIPLCFTLVACRPAPGLPKIAAANPNPSPSTDIAVVGTVIDEPIGYPAPGTPTPSPKPQATATATATPTPTPVFVPFAVQVTVSSPVTSLNVPPPTGQTAIYQTSAQLSAVVLMSNGLSNKNVTWSSSNVSLATVNLVGLVTAVGSASGPVTISAVSADGQATGSVTLAITTLGDTQVTVQ